MEMLQKKKIEGSTIHARSKRDHHKDPNMLRELLETLVIHEPPHHWTSSFYTLLVDSRPCFCLHACSFLVLRAALPLYATFCLLVSCCLSYYNDARERRASRSSPTIQTRTNMNA